MLKLSPSGSLSLASRSSVEIVRAVSFSTLNPSSATAVGALLTISPSIIFLIASIVQPKPSSKDINSTSSFKSESNVLITSISSSVSLNVILKLVDRAVSCSKIASLEE